MTERDYPVSWRQSAQARRISLRIDPARRVVVVTCPRSVPLHQAQAFLATHDKWVRNKLGALPDVPHLLPNAQIFLNDQNLTLIHVPEQRQTALIKSQQLRINGPIARFEYRVLAFLKHQAGLILSGELKLEATLMSAKVTRFACSNAKTRWGSCTRTGRIMLNWRLIMMPRKIRRYIMVHELAHLEHFDHSPAFWAKVDQHCHDRKQAQTWLTHHGTALLALG